MNIFRVIAVGCCFWRTSTLPSVFLTMTAIAKPFALMALAKQVAEVLNWN
ncbi:hypothetical protein [Fischerella thermalis]|nr:hypothetical protein [Fischerella thermalis]